MVGLRAVLFDVYVFLPLYNNTPKIFIETI